MSLPDPVRVVLRQASVWGTTPGIGDPALLFVHLGNTFHSCILELHHLPMGLHNADAMFSIDSSRSLTEPQATMMRAWHNARRR